MGSRLLLSLLLLLLPGRLLAETIRLTTLEWPPYTTESLPDGGLTGHIVKQAFAKAGLKVEFDFYPWQRAVRLAADPAQPYSGYFPEYLSATLPTLWRSSPSIGDSALGLAQQAGPLLVWQQLPDLARYRIGVVTGYINTREFDDLMASGRLNTFATGADNLNLRKLLYNRLDLAVIDRDVFHWLMHHDAKLAPPSPQLQFHPQILEHKSLHIMFRPDQQAIQLRVEEAINQLDIERLSRDYQQRYLTPRH